VKLRRHCWAGLAALVLAACSTVASRIDDNRAAFNSYPPAVQQKIRAGQVDIGFTPDMVRMALGDPDHRYERTTAAGQSEIWGYSSRGPQFSIGIGGFGGSGNFGGGVGVSTGSYGPLPDALSVIFQDGKVVAVDRNVSR
jgi:hypothetical protein